MLVRQFDGQSDYDGGRPWLPCPATNWCAQHEQFWPSSILNKNVRRLYYADTPGMILDPQHVTMLCACQADCNSNSQARGLRGCNAQRCCDYPEPRCIPHHVDHDCSYPPEELWECLAAQERRGVPSHNEVVLDNLKTAERMPEAVLGFFWMAESSRAVAERVHGAFLLAYGLSEERCPLVRLRLEGSGDPFG